MGVNWGAIWQDMLLAEAPVSQFNASRVTILDPVDVFKADAF